MFDIRCLMLCAPPCFCFLLVGWLTKRRKGRMARGGRGRTEGIGFTGGRVKIKKEGKVD